MISTVPVALPIQLGVAELSASVRSVLSFAVVLLAGVAFLRWRGPMVDRAVDRTVEGSPVAVVYGVVAFVLVVVIAAYGLTQVARLGASGTVLRTVGELVGGAALVALSAFGYLVLGVYLTEVEGARRPLLGALVGAVLSALPWLVLSTLPALAAWALLSAVGLGSPTRHYIHGDRTVATEAG
jgi:hypothetical protein